MRASPGAEVILPDDMAEAVSRRTNELAEQLAPATPHEGWLVGRMALHAVRLDSGQRVWFTPPPPPKCAAGPNCNGAQSNAITVISGVVFSGSVDGHLRAYSTATGEVIWDMDTAREYPTVNGATARGGSLDVAGPVIAGGMLYVTSGYALWGGMPGNVLLAFAVRGGGGGK